MSENHKYYYLKLKDNFFDSEEMKLLDTMKNGKDYQILYLKLCLLSLKNDGALMFKGMIPYDFSMISTITNMSIDTVKTALELFKKIGLVTVTDTGTIYMSDIQLLIGQSSTEAERQQKYRQRITNDVTNVTTNVQHLCNKSSNKCNNKCTTNGHQRLDIRDKRLENNIIAPATAVADTQKTTDAPVDKIKHTEEYKEVEGHYAEQWAILYTEKKVVTDKPAIDFKITRTLLKGLFESGFTVEQINGVVDKAMRDGFIQQNGYSLKTILSAGMFNKLLNGSEPEKEWDVSKQGLLGRHEGKKRDWSEYYAPEPDAQDCTY